MYFFTRAVLVCIKYVIQPKGISVLDKYVHEPALAAGYGSCTTCYSHPIVVFMCGLCGHSSCCLSHLCLIKAKKCMNTRK